MFRFAPAFLLLTPLICQQPPDQRSPADHLDLKVLYAGTAAHARTSEWREFLAPRAAAFDVIDVTELTEQAAADCDLLILDCPDPLVRDESDKVTSIRVPRPRALTATFARPTIVVGGMAMITDGLQLKSNWL